MSTTGVEPLGFFASALPGAAGAYGYNELLDNISSDRANTSAGIGNLQTAAAEMTEFQPWSVTSNVGNVTGGPNGQTTMTLTPEQKFIQDAMAQSGASQMGAAGQDPRQREQEVFNRMMAAFQPGQDRQAAEMRERLHRQGRSGMRSERYGGSPEELAMAKAQVEGRNTAMLNAMGFTQDELQNQYTRGRGTLEASYLPSEQLNKQGGLGTNLQQLEQARRGDASSMFTQLGLGGITADTNYSNVEGNAYGNMISALLPLLQGAGQGIDNNDGLWSTIQKFF